MLSNMPIITTEAVLTVLPCRMSPVTQPCHEESRGRHDAGTMVTTVTTGCDFCDSVITSTVASTRYRYYLLLTTSRNLDQSWVNV